MSGELVAELHGRVAAVMMKTFGGLCCFMEDRESFCAAGLDEREDLGFSFFVLGVNAAEKVKLQVLIGDWRKQSYGNWAAALNDDSAGDDEPMQEKHEIAVLIVDWREQSCRNWAATVAAIMIGTCRGDAEGLHEPMKELRDKRKT
ncbi:hypothetical protein M0R45_028546 [Rubus argutus]|uniref:Uncharacterized protein n=1 Tax=Rubus argutus TaxID=59490 RepID=A0AAW1W7Z3_RUBAR